MILPLCKRSFLRAFFLPHAGHVHIEGGTARHATACIANWAFAPILTGGADMRVKITLVCSECKQRNYETKKNKKNDPDRLEMNKYCRFCKKHTLHKETK